VALYTERVLSLDELQERGQFDAVVIATGAAMASLPEAAATAQRTLTLVKGQVRCLLLNSGHVGGLSTL